uniref:Reverse transcriptase domain-containing protein n=1 Tax=Nothobranchius furzeri TaxID=105023 RepID=A0A8C6PUA8_NOTFU
MRMSMAKDIHNLNTTFIKKHHSYMLEPITYLVNLSIQTKSFPESWKTAIIAPVYKSGEKDLASNYRPIAILPIVSKILEKIVAEQLMDHLESNQLLYSQQFGFRQKYSTESANCYLLEKIKTSLDKGCVVGAVFLDLKKAFDTVNHSILLNKLMQFKISPEALKWFSSYLEGRQQCVRVNEVKSSLLANNMGVPQGSVLGPLLFTMYINDLPMSCSGVNCQMYADDTVIYVSTKTPGLAGERLTQALSDISEWLESSHLTLNVKKTVSICFSMRNRPDQELFQVRIKEEIIEVRSDVKYLGIILDKHLKFDSQVKHVCNKVKTNLNCFRFIRRNLSHQTAKLYMHALIFPHLSYCITSWSQASSTTLKPIVLIYKQAIKIMDQKPLKWHHCRILRKHNLLTFENFINFSTLRFFFNCLNDKLSKLFSTVAIRRRSSHRTITRASTCGDCLVPRCKTSFGQSALSVKGAKLWNSLPTDLKLETDSNVFNKELKKWLKSKQQCLHE